MKANYSILLLLIFGINLYSQNYITSIPFLIKKGGRSFSYVDKSSDESYLFIANQKKIKAIRYSKAIEILDSLTVEIPNNKNKEILGCTKSNTGVNLIWISDNSNKIYFQNFDFSAKKAVITFQDLVLNKESIVQTYSSNDYFYCLSIVDNSSILKLYIFNNKNEKEVKTIDLSASTFYDSNNKRTNLYSLMNENFAGYEGSFELQNIDTDNPTSLFISSKKRKSYKIGNDIYLTFDNSLLSTQIIKINLTTFESKPFAINTTTNINNAQNNAQSNSFLYENNLYQLKISSDNLAFVVNNLDGTNVKEYINSSQEIPFKRSDFNWELVNNATTAKMDTTSQFLTALTSQRIGITCYNYKGKNLVSIGAISKKVKKIDEDQNGAYFFNPGMKGAIAGGLWAAAYVLLSNSGLSNNYASGRDALSMNTLFSKDFVIQDEKINRYAASNISSFFNGYSEIMYPTLFSIKDKAYLGHYNIEAKQFVILKFEN